MAKLTLGTQRPAEKFACGLFCRLDQFDILLQERVDELAQCDAADLGASGRKYSFSRSGTTSMRSAFADLPGPVGSTQFRDWNKHAALGPWRAVREALTRDADAPMPTT